MTRDQEIISKKSKAAKTAIPCPKDFPHFLREVFLQPAFRTLAHRRPHSEPAWRPPARTILYEARHERLASPKDLPTYLAKLDTIIEEKNKLFG